MTKTIFLAALVLGCCTFFGGPTHADNHLPPVQDPELDKPDASPNDPCDGTWRWRQFCAQIKYESDIVVDPQTGEEKEVFKEVGCSRYEGRHVCEPN